MKITRSQLGFAAPKDFVLTHATRTLEVSPPRFYVEITPGDVKDVPEAWIDPLQSDAIIDAVVDDFRGWLLSKR